MLLTLFDKDDASGIAGFFFFFPFAAVLWSSLDCEERLSSACVSFALLGSHKH